MRSLSAAAAIAALSLGLMLLLPARVQAESSDHLIDKMNAPRGDTESLDQFLNRMDESRQLSRKRYQLSSKQRRLRSKTRELMLKGEYGQALVSAKQLVDITKQISGDDSKDYDNDITLLAVIYFNIGHYSEAEALVKRVMKIRENEGGKDHFSVVTCRTFLARLYSGQGRFSEAEALLKQSLELQERNLGRDHFFVAICLEGLAYLYLDQGLFDRAKPVIDRLREWQSKTDLVKRVGLRSSIGWWLLLTHQYDDARRYYIRLIEFGEKRGEVSSLFIGYTGLGTAYEGLKDYRNAEDKYSKAVKIVEEMRSTLHPARRKTFLAIRKGGFYYTEPAKGLTRVHMKTNQFDVSIYSSELTRGRALSDQIALTSDQGVARVPRNILDKEAKLVSQLAELAQSRKKMNKLKNRHMWDNENNKVEKARKDLDDFVEMLWKQYKAYAAVKYPRPVRLKESAIQPDEHLVMFDVLGEGVGVKLIKGRKIIRTHFRKWTQKELEKDVKKFRLPFEKMQLKGFDPDLGKKLYRKLLLRALVDVPEGTPLMIIPDGVLAALPFEVLVMGGKATWKEGAHGDHPEGLQYVGDVYPISYYESITALTLARTLGKKTAPGKKLLVITDPVFSSEDDRIKTMSVKKKRKLLASLPSTLMSIKSEIGLAFPRLTLTGDLGESLKKLYSGEVDLYTGMKAQKDLLFKKPLNGYGGIVFATHGYFGTDLPGIQEPVLALTLLDHPNGKDGFLRMTEVMGLKLNADIVALTACQTGLGRRISGEGTMGMGRAFQYAGARSVLMSLWSVAEKSSVMLVESFFRHLKEGKNKLEALKLARKEIREAGYDHPFYWAPFILVGEVN